MNDQPTGPFCQSCAMPMAKPDDFGTEADGSPSQEYCTYCYQKGEFVQPDMTKEEMIEFVAKKMSEMGMDDEMVVKTKQFIPQLKRWQG